MLNAIEISPKIWWVGGIDWNERSFHGYTTEKGITYNAYLIMDEKITLIDTAKATFTDEFLQRISQVVDPSKIDIVITNHVEMDHSGSLPAIHKVAPNATIYASAGAGVNARNIPALVRETGVTACHLSGKKRIPSRMVFRREGVPMGLPGFDEFELWQTDPDAVRAARAALDALSD